MQGIQAKNPGFEFSNRNCVGNGCDNSPGHLWIEKMNPKPLMGAERYLLSYTYEEGEAHPIILTCFVLLAGADRPNNEGLVWRSRS